MQMYVSCTHAAVVQLYEFFAIMNKMLIIFATGLEFIIVSLLVLLIKYFCTRNEHINKDKDLWSM
jgi:hypothetical protein